MTFKKKNANMKLTSKTVIWQLNLIFHIIFSFTNSYLKKKEEEEEEEERIIYLPNKILISWCSSMFRRVFYNLKMIHNDEIINSPIT